MSSKAGLPLTRHIAPRLAIWGLSLASGLTVFGLAIFFQWLIYDDWLHDSGPVRIVGSLLAGTLMFAVAFRWQIGVRARRLEILHRFETIRWMNDRIPATLCRPSSASPTTRTPRPPTRSAAGCRLHRVRPPGRPLADTHAPTPHPTAHQRESIQNSLVRAWRAPPRRDCPVMNSAVRASRQQAASGVVPPSASL